MKAKLVAESLREAMSYKPRVPSHPDLTKVKGSVGASIEKLVQNIDQYKSIEDLADAFIDILENPKTKLSKAKKMFYMDKIDKIYNLGRMRKFITDAYLKAANLGIY